MDASIGRVVKLTAWAGGALGTLRAQPSRLLGALPFGNKLPPVEPSTLPVATATMAQAGDDDVAVLRDPAAHK